MRSEVKLLALGLILLAASSASASETKAPESEDSVRTLEAIQIEGEIAIPQVLFITSRDHPRYRDDLRERYRRSALEIARETSFPRRFRPLSEHQEPQK